MKLSIIFGTRKPFKRVRQCFVLGAVNSYSNVTILAPGNMFALGVELYTVYLRTYYPCQDGIL